MKDYRKYFKKYYGIEFGKDYAIHHIDLDHNNNDIENLMILPKYLHEKYHFYLNCLREDETLNVNINVKISGNCVNSNSYRINAMSNLAVIIEQCNRWYDYKMYLDKKMPNIHHIEVK